MKTFPLSLSSHGEQRKSRQSRRSAFTLIEMLVVMAIIGLLAGLVFPTVTAVRKKAYATQTHEMVNQVQNAWKIHKNDFRSFPAVSIFEHVEKDTDDIVIPMSPHNLCVLNWRCPKPTTYDGSTDGWTTALKKTIADEVGKGADNKPHSAAVSGKNTNGKNTTFSISTQDKYFEISQIQWICGVLNSWGERKAQVLFKKGGVEAAATAAEVLKQEKFADPRVFAELDMDGDDKVRSLNSVAIAWVAGASPKDEEIVSW